MQDAFAVSMYEPAFREAAWAGRAFVMKDVLVRNGAPPDLVLSAEDFPHESTDAGAAIPRTSDHCVRWQVVVWKIGGIVYTRAVMHRLPGNDEEAAFRPALSGSMPP